MRRFVIGPWSVIAGLTLALLTACASASTETPTPTATYTPRPTATRRPPTITPSLTPSPAPPTATPIPSLRQLSRDECCTQPFWSPDSQQVWYVDRPSTTQRTGIWGIDRRGGEPEFITERLGIYTRDRQMVAYLEAGQTFIEKIGGERWVIPNGGRFVEFSPDSKHIVWQQALSYANFDRRKVEIWVGNVDGSGGRPIAELIGGWFYGWFPDSQRLLVSGKTSLTGESLVAALNINDGTLTRLAEGYRIRGGTVSPLGKWVAYMVTFSGEPDKDGLWVARADGSGAQRLAVFGAYAWRGEGRLLVIPLENSTSHRVLEVNVETGLVRALTNPAQTAFQIAGGDWSLSPTGQYLAFVSARDRRLWVLDLPACTNTPNPCPIATLLPDPSVINP